MNIEITQPPIPVLWLDTWCLLTLTRALIGVDETKKAEAEEVIRLVTKLTNERKLLCPEGDQGIEIEQSNNDSLVESARSLQARLSQGIKLQYFQTIHDLQVQRMMKAVAHGDSKVVFPWTDIFYRDPISELETAGQFIVSVRLTPSRDDLDARIASNKSLATQWELIRLKSQSSNRKYEPQLEAEFKTESIAIRKILNELAMKQLSGETATVDELLVALGVVGKPLSWWKRATGNEVDLVGALAFFESEDYRRIWTAPPI